MTEASGTAFKMSTDRFERPGSYEIFSLDNLSRIDGCKVLTSRTLLYIGYGGTTRLIHLVAILWAEGQVAFLAPPLSRISGSPHLSRCRFHEGGYGDTEKGCE